MPLREQPPQPDGPSPEKTPLLPYPTGVSEAAASSSEPARAEFAWLPELEREEVRKKLKELGGIEKVRGDRTVEHPLGWSVFAFQSVTPTDLRARNTERPIDLLSTNFVSLRPLRIGEQLEQSHGSKSVEWDKKESAVGGAIEEIHGALTSALLKNRIHTVWFSDLGLKDELEAAHWADFEPGAAASNRRSTIGVAVTTLLSPYDRLSQEERFIPAPSAAKPTSDVEAQWTSIEVRKRTQHLKALEALYPERFTAQQRARLVSIDGLDFSTIAALSGELNTGVTADEIIDALELANLLEEVETTNLRQVAEKNPVLLDLRLLSILPAFNEVSLPAYDKVVPEAAALVRRYNQLDVPLPLLGDQTPEHTRPIHALESSGWLDADEQQARAILEARFGIPSGQFERISSKYHRFIQDHSATLAGSELKNNPIVQDMRSQDNDVDTATAVELLQYATWQGEAVNRYQHTGDRERIQFEARRKIYLMGEIVQAVKHYESAQQRARGPLARIVKDLIFPASKEGMAEQRDGDGTLRAVKLVSELTDDERASGEWKYLETRLRQFTLPDGTVVPIQHDTRFKDEESFIRKWILGDRNPTDLYGSAIVFCLPAEHPLLEVVEKSVVIGPPISLGGATKAPTKSYTDHRIVFEFIEALRARASERYGDRCQQWVSKYSATPTGPDRGLPGKDGGSEDNDLRLAKLAIHLRGLDGDGVQRTFTEEFQLSTADAFGTGLYYWAVKREDSESYQKRRLIRPLRAVPHLSVEELLFPHRHFDPVR